MKKKKTQFIPPDRNQMEFSLSSADMKQLQEIAAHYRTVLNLVKEYPNDQDLGRNVRKLTNEIQGIKPESTQYIGVVAYNRENFRNWAEEQNLKPNLTGKIKDGNTIYLCITNETHLRGYRLDKIIETGLAIENKEYAQIMAMSKYCLIKIK